MRQLQDRFNWLLTEDQARIWRELTGDPFEFPAPFATTPPSTTTPKEMPPARR